MVTESVVNSVRKYLRQIKDNGLDVSFGVIFGSYATGFATELSDIDLLVVSPIFDGQFSRSQIHSLWETAAITDSRIEPMPCGLKQWEKDLWHPLIDTAHQQGQIVTLN